MKLLIVAALVAIAQAAPAPPSSPGPSAPMPAGCYVNDAYGPVSYKYAPGNVFPTDANHPHGLRLVDSAAHCCTLCQTYKNCSFWTYSAGGTPAQPTCYSFSGACCFLKTDAAKGQEQPDKASVVSGSTKPYPPVPTGPLTVTVDWNTEVITTQTAATVEVDVMPFLGEADWGGPYEAYKSALGNLNSEFVRFAPWFANPRVVVPELTPHVCTATQPSTNWNSTYFDGVMKDFMEAVCGPDAAKGACTHSVVQQLSTMPEYMYVGGDANPLPAYPWNTTDPFDEYKAGNALVDPTCKQMARYFGRLVGWYTNGGFTDECGHFHPSEFHYDWWGISVLNEDEHAIKPENGPAYTTCYDAIKIEVEKVNKKVTLVGPEVVMEWGYMEYFLKAENHADKQAPPVASYHWFGGMVNNNTGEDFMTRWMSDYWDPNGIVQGIQRTIAATGQKTEAVLNEYIPFINDWCNCTGLESLCGNSVLPAMCPDWQKPSTGGGYAHYDLRTKKGLGINRATWSWNSAAAVFALGYATLAELGYKYVGADQLVGGTWPDNEPAVSCMDWQTGETNVKYHAIKMLADSVGSKANKTIYNSTLTGAGTGGAGTKHAGPIHVMPYTMAGKKAMLVVNMKQTAQVLTVVGATEGAAVSVLEVDVNSKEPGFAGPPITRKVGANGAVALGPFAIALVDM